MKATLIPWILVSGTALAPLVAFSNKTPIEVPVKKLRIALVYPKKGQFSNFLCASKAAIESLKGPQIEVETVVFDIENEATQTLGIGNAIIADGRFDAVVGTRTSQEALMLAEVLKESDVPFVSPLASHPDFISKYRNTFRLVASSDHYAVQSADRISKYAKAKEILIVKNLSLPYSTNYAERVLENLKKHDGKLRVQVYEYISSDSAMKGLAEQIQQRSPEIVYFPSYANEFASLLNNFPNTKTGLKIFGQGGLNDGVDFILSKSLQRPDLEIYMNAIWNEQVNGPHKSSYLDIVKNKCKEEGPQLRTAAAFDSILLVMSALQNRPNLRKTELINSMARTNITGIMGKISFDKRREIFKKAVFRRISKGEQEIETE